MAPVRDVALVLSGGGMNGMLLEVGFLKRLRESELWDRLGWVYGTSAGALAGVMAALDRLDELEAFVLELRPDETFRPHRIWQLPFAGLHDYALPRTIAERLGPPAELVGALHDAPVELVVIVTDVGHPEAEVLGAHPFERVYASRSTPADEMGHALLASAAISALVLPLRVGDVIGTDGGWVRNFPLGHAYDNPDVEQIVAFRYMARYPRTTGDNLQRLRQRLEPFRAVPPVRALIAEVRLAEERQGRGEPAHLADMIVRLMRVAIARNTVLEERFAADKDASVRELGELRRDVAAIAARHAPPWRRRAARRAVEARFGASRFPFRHDRDLPTLVVRGDAGAATLDPSFRSGLEWPLEAKHELIGRGYAFADETLRAHGVGPRPEEGETP